MRRLFLTAVVGLLLSTASAASGQSATLSLSPSHGLPGASITASGSGFSPGGSAFIFMDSPSDGSNHLAAATVNASGAFSTTFKVPNSGAGSHTVFVCKSTAEGGPCGELARKSFTIDGSTGATAAPGATTPTTRGTTGTTIRSGTATTTVGGGGGSDGGGNGATVTTGSDGGSTATTSLRGQRTVNPSATDDDDNGVNNRFLFYGIVIVGVVIVALSGGIIRRRHERES